MRFYNPDRRHGKADMIDVGTELKIIAKLRFLQVVIDFSERQRL